MPRVIPMFVLLVGLGNPGAQYALNRHNAGFMAIDALAYAYNAGPEKRMGRAIVREVTINNTRVLLAKPLAYMNVSGPPIAEVATFYKIPLDNIVVFHDDMALEPMRVRVKKGGGSAGHNGLKSLDASIGKDYWRVRMGIGHPGDRERVSGYVLQNFSNSEIDELGDLLGDMVDNVSLLFNADKNAFVTKLSLAKSSNTNKG